MTDQGIPRVRVRTMRPSTVHAARQRDTLDRAIDNAQAQGRLVSLEEAFPEPPSPQPQSDNSQVRQFAEVAQSEDARDYNREHKLKLVHRLLMRNLPIDLIAQQLNVTPRNVFQLRAEVLRRLKEEAKNIDTYTFFGRTMAFYDEVRGTALRLATDVKMAGGTRVQALAASLAADQGKLRFLETAGFFDHNRFAPPPKEVADSVEGGRKRLSMVMEAMRRTMEGDDADVSYDAIVDTAEPFDDDVSLL